MARGSLSFLEGSGTCSPGHLQLERTLLCLTHLLDAQFKFSSFSSKVVKNIWEPFEFKIRRQPLQAWLKLW